MNTLLKNLGVLILLIGAAVLAGAYFTSSLTNTILLVCLVVIILGYLTHILLNKKAE
jgi:hypothetical protein